MTIQDANELIRIHGKKAAQVVVDQIVAAVKRGDDDTVTELDRALRYIERQLEACC